MTTGNWIFVEPASWVTADKLPELKELLENQAEGAGPLPAASPGKAALSVKPGSLRRIKVFAEMDERQLESFLGYMEVLRFKQFAKVVRKGDHGDAIFFVLEGEVRAFTMIDGKETTLSTMSTGDSFGEISVLDHGPRSADVVANRESVLLKISSSRIERLLREAPALAAPFLYSLSRSIVGRMRGLTKKYEDSIHLSRLGREIS